MTAVKCHYSTCILHSSLYIIIPTCFYHSKSVWNKSNNGKNYSYHTIADVNRWAVMFICPYCQGWQCYQQNRKYYGKVYFFPEEYAFISPRKLILQSKECFENVSEMKDYDYLYKVCACPVLKAHMWKHYLLLTNWRVGREAVCVTLQINVWVEECIEIRRTCCTKKLWTLEKNSFQLEHKLKYKSIRQFASHYWTCLTHTGGPLYPVFCATLFGLTRPCLLACGRM